MAAHGRCPLQLRLLDDGAEVRQGQDLLVLLHELQEVCLDDIALSQPPIFMALSCLLHGIQHSEEVGKATTASPRADHGLMTQEDATFSSPWHPQPHRPKPPASPWPRRHRKQLAKGRLEHAAQHLRLILALEAQGALRIANSQSPWSP